MGNDRQLSTKSRVFSPYPSPSGFMPKGMLTAEYVGLLILTNPAMHFPCGRKPKNPEKTHDFQQSVDEFLIPTCDQMLVPELELQ